MKKLLWLLPGIVILTGCTGNNPELHQAMRLRSGLLSAEKSYFCAEITADYGDELYEFRLECEADPQGDLRFCVLEPEAIAEISGKICETGGELIFDGTALSFPLMTDDQITPVMAPWIMVRALRSGYIASACRENELAHLTLEDSYDDGALQVDVWMKEDLPVRSDILWEGRRILALELSSFRML